jgi:hypothetical protein
MPGQQHDLHGNAPKQAPVALLLIDVINNLAFPDGKALLKQALPSACFSQHPRHLERSAIKSDVSQ